MYVLRFMACVLILKGVAHFHIVHDKVSDCLSYAHVVHGNSCLKKIHWPIKALRWLHKQKHTHTLTNTQQMATPPPPFTSYIRVPVATGQDRSHLNGAFLVHRWAPSLPLLLLFFIVMSRVSNESRSACAGLLLQARWDSIEMAFGGWPTWCNHNAARDAFSYPFDNNNREVNTCKCTQMHTCTDKASNS